MGLDITAYSRLRYVGHHDEWNDEDAHYEQHVEAFAYKKFPHALMGVPDVRVEHFRSGGEYLAAGCFEVTDKTEEHGFAAGSYRRDRLPEAADPGSGRHRGAGGAEVITVQEALARAER